MPEPPVAVEYRGVVYKRNPQSQQRAHRVYYTAPWKSGRDSLHRDIWRDHNRREIPDGWHIHHIDHDPFNNDPGNLRAVSPVEHARQHPDRMSGAPLDHLEKIRPLAAAWHRSPEGLDWHREHGAQTWEDREPVGQRTCESCGLTFDAWFERARYCSRACINRAREHKYLETATCPVCGGDFNRDRYHKDRARTCSRKCGAQLRKRRAASAK
jgi:hypothetical protein